MKTLFFIFFSLQLSLGSRSATVDTIDIHSGAMRQSFKCVVIKPEGYKKRVRGGIAENRYPVLYLLHGYGGWYSNWLIRVPELKEYADQYNILIVCPDGGKSSWYLDSPVDTSMKYETYIGREVPAYIDLHYFTIPDRKARALSGLSMGGYGSLFIGFRNAGTFGACGSMSGGVDLNYSRNKYDVIKRIGDTIRYAENWKTYSIPHIVESYPKDSLALIIDCGTADIFFAINQSLHEKMLRLKIPHEYIERPGKHDWAYWANAVQYQLLFFSNYFKAK